MWGFTLALVAELPKAHSQHVLPVPGCPARGLTPPGSSSLPYLPRVFGCSPSGIASDAGAAEDGSPDSPPLFLPDWMHQYKGITGEYIYTGEVFSNVHGGLNTNGATRYRGNLDLVMNVDTEAMDMWKGGRFFIYGEQFHGHTLTARDIGDTQFYSNIDSSPRPNDAFQIMEYWYEHSLMDDGSVIVKVGKQDANADFAYSDLGSDFVNSSFGFSPTIPLVTWPNPSLGVATFIDLTDSFHFRAGIYDGAPSFGVPTGGQWGLSSLGHNGAFSLLESSYTPQLGTDGDLPGTYKVGVWLHSGKFADLTTGGATEVSGNHGYYAVIDQLIWKEPGSDETPQGLGFLAQWGWSPSDRNVVDRHIGSGLTYRGLIKNRDTDVLGLGVTSADFSDRTLYAETNLELFYKAQIREWMIVQPDLQYIANPSGTNPDALVIGARTEMVF